MARAVYGRDAVRRALRAGLRRYAALAARRPGASRMRVEQPLLATLSLSPSPQATPALVAPADMARRSGALCIAALALLALATGALTGRLA